MFAQSKHKLLDADAKRELLLGTVEQAQWVSAWRMKMGGRLSIGMQWEKYIGFKHRVYSAAGAGVRRPGGRRAGESLQAQRQWPDALRGQGVVRRQPQCGTGGSGQCAAAAVLTAAFEIDKTLNGGRKGAAGDPLIGCTSGFLNFHPSPRQKSGSQIKDQNCGYRGLPRDAHLLSQ